MSEKLIRVYRKIDFELLKKHLLIYGDLSGQCAHCNHLDIKLDEKICPKCKNEFKFIAFRKPQSHLPKIQKLIQEKPYVDIVDYDDFHKMQGASKAEGFFK